MRVLAISAHADDETLGCGGTLLRHAAAGDQIHWLIATSRTSPPRSQSDVSLRDKQIQSVADEYRVESPVMLGHPDASLDQVPMSVLVEGILGAVEAARPEVVYVVNASDVHTDHNLVNTAAMAAMKAFRMGALGVRRILAYETLSSTEAAAPGPGRVFAPNVFADISDFIEAKCELFAQFESEVQDDGLPRSSSAITALARFRGATVGVEYAEAFMLMRELL
jgi:LmbE family N-acetylglucosaminyl deacetylase